MGENTLRTSMVYLPWIYKLKVHVTYHLALPYYTHGDHSSWHGRLPLNDALPSTSLNHSNGEVLPNTES